MTDERLTGIALMYIHSDMDIDVNEVVNRFVTTPLSVKTKMKRVSSQTTSTHAEDEDSSGDSHDHDSVSDDLSDSDTKDVNYNNDIVKRRRITF